MCISVSGSSGFIGKAFTQLLREKQVAHSIISRDKRKAGSTSEITPLFDIDLVDVVVHLAGKAHEMEGPSKSLDTSIRAEYQSANCTYALEVARSAAKKGMKRFVFVSSLSVYGVSSSANVLSESSSVNPKSYYAESKLDAERELQKLSSDLGFELVVLRPALVYGAGAPGNFGKLLKLINLSRLIPIGTKKNERSLVCIDNLVHLLLLVCQKEQLPYSTFNVADYESVSTFEIVKYISLGMNKRILILNLPRVIWRYLLKLIGKDTVYEQLFEDLVINTDKLRNDLNWSPPYTIEQGLLKSGENAITRP